MTKVTVTYLQTVSGFLENVYGRTSFCQVLYVLLLLARNAYYARISDRFRCGLSMSKVMVTECRSNHDLSGCTPDGMRGTVVASPDAPATQVGRLLCLPISTKRLKKRACLRSSRILEQVHRICSLQLDDLLASVSLDLGKR